MSDIILRASLFADAAHAAIGQVRKYTGDPYIVHPRAVATIVFSYDGTHEMVAAALLHDVVEDTKITVELIEHHFGPVVAGYVDHLTDEFTPDKYPHINRAERKLCEATRYATVPDEVKTIKLADMIDNTHSIAEHDPGFMKTYGPEKRRLLESLRGGNERLLTIAGTILAKAGY